MLSDGENIRNLGKELSIEINNLRQNLESALRACNGQDRSLCTIIDSSGLQVTLRIDQVNSIHFYKLILIQYYFKKYIYFHYIFFFHLYFYYSLYNFHYIFNIYIYIFHMFFKKEQFKRNKC